MQYQRNPRCALALLLWLSLWVGLPVQAQDWVYTVRPGDTLWALGEKYLLTGRDWRELQTYNQLGSTALSAGSRLRVPVAWLKLRPADVKVLAVQGTARLAVTRGQRDGTVTVGMLLQAGDRLETGPDSSVLLEFADGSQSLIQAESVLTLDKVGGYEGTGLADTELRLEQGRTDNTVNPGHEGGALYQINTPSAVAAVRGTEYRVAAVAAEAVARTEVLSGAVAFSNAGRRVSVPAGFGAIAATAKPPRAPIPLLPGPAQAELPPLYDRSPLPIRIPAVTGAVAYRVQVATAEPLTGLLFDRSSTALTVRGPDLPDGHYVLRLRAIDAQGLEGFDTVHPFELNARPEPPVQVAPAPNATVIEEQPVLQWSKSVVASAYRVQVARDAEFSHVLLEQGDVDSTTLTVTESLPPGTYYWRVASLDDTGWGPYSDPVLFRRPQPSPGAEPPAVDETTLILRWRAGLPGERYQVQFGKDWQFNELLIDSEVAEPQLTIARPESGLYYLRIRVIETDGYVGPFGARQQINVPPSSVLPYIIYPLFLLL